VKGCSNRRRSVEAGQRPVTDLIIETNPKSLSGRASDRANMRGRVPRPACRSRGRPRKLGPRCDLAHLVAADSDCGWSCTACCALGGRNLTNLLRGLRNDPQSNVRVSVQMTPREPPRSSRRMRLDDRQGAGRWASHHLLRAFAPRVASWNEGEYCHKTNYCSRIWLQRSFPRSRQPQPWIGSACWG